MPEQTREAAWRCPYCGVESFIADAARRRAAIASHLLNNHADALNAIGTDREVGRR